MNFFLHFRICCLWKRAGQRWVSENCYIETHNIRMGVFALANYYLIPKLCFTKSILTLDITKSFVHHLKKKLYKKAQFYIPLRQT